MSAVLKFHAKLKYTGLETRQYVLRHETALHLKLARLLKDLGERIAKATETVSLGALTKVEWHEEDHPRDEDGKFTDIGDIRKEGEEVSNQEVVSALTRHGHAYRGMTQVEFDATIGAGKGIVSRKDFSHESEGTSFGEDAETSESYANYGSSDPRKTGKPTYLVEVKRDDRLVVDRRDYYLKAKEEIPRSNITRVIQMRPEGKRIVGRDITARVLFDIKKVSLAALTKAAKPVTPPWLRRLLAKVKLDEFAVKLADAIEPESEAAYKAAGLFANQVLSTQNAPVSRFDLIDERAVAFAARRAAWLVGSGTNPAYAITDAVREDVRRIVTQATEEGWAAQTLAREIRDAEAFSDARAKNIARTELAFAHEQGALDEWRASGAVVGKRSILADTHPQSDVCDAAADEGVIPLDAMFASGVDAPPHHPSCLCAMVPEVEIPVKKVRLALLRKAWDESLHPRDAEGRFVATGATPEQARQIEEILSRERFPASDLSIQGGLSTHIVNGQKFEADAVQRAGKVTLNEKAIKGWDRDQLDRVLTHEITHAKFYELTRKALRQGMWDRYIESNLDSLVESGRQVSGYTNQWWNHVAKTEPRDRQDQTRKAVNETLAEIRGNKRAVPKVYQPIFEAMDQVWDKKWK